LAGDALLTKSFEIMLNKNIHEDVDEKLMLEAAYKLALASGDSGMVAGQFADIKAEGGNFDKNIVKYIHNHKTAALIAYSAELGAILGYADDENKANIKLFGIKIGRAFQIIDDIMDITSTTEEMGKDAGSDMEKNKATYPAVFGMEKSKMIAEDLVEEAISLLDKYGKAAFPLKEIAYFVTNRKK
jgi:geranylgeranyl diphosphate synthase type II